MNVNIWVVRTRGVRIDWSQQGRIIMSTARFVSPREAAEEPTTLLSMMSNGPTQLGHRDSIGKDQEEEKERDGFDTTVPIPDM